MKNSVSNGNQQNKRILRFEDGRMYFSKYTEHKFFFALTLIMLLLGAILRLGGWQ